MLHLGKNHAFGIDHHGQAQLIPRTHDVSGRLAQAYGKALELIGRRDLIDYQAMKQTGENKRSLIRGNAKRK